MKTVSALVAALTLPLLMSIAAAETLPPIKEVVSFGDSLTDAGTYWFRFTSNPGLTFAQHLAVRYGQMPLPNEHMDSYGDGYQGKHGMPGPGGLNYAEGGAKANSAYSSVSQDPEGLPISTTVQLNHFLAQHKKFSPDQLVTFYVGTNDAAYNYDPDKSPELAKQLQDNKPPAAEVMSNEKAKRVLVFKLVDLGNLPWFHSEASQAYVRELGRAFNARLLAELPKDDEHLLVIDTEAFADDLIANAAKYGFKHGSHEDACKLDDQDYCFPETLKEPDADHTYIFVAGEHMTTRANELLADYVMKQLEVSPLK
jgi:phospholipase/lecithinase/hemolysin